MCDRNLPISMEGSVESTRKATGTCPLAKKVRKMANAAAEAFSNTGGCSGLTPPYIGGRPTHPDQQALGARPGSTAGPGG